MSAKTYKHVSEVFDPETGEIISDTTYTVSTSSEDDYIKIYSYLNTVFAFKGINPKLIPVLIEISGYMSFADKGQEVTLVKSVKERISQSLGINMRTINNYILELKRADILRPIGRSVYAVNPFIVGRGKWSDIKELRAKFDFNAGLMETQTTITDLITGQTMAKIIQETKKDKAQIPGQMEFGELGDIEDEQN